MHLFGSDREAKGQGKTKVTRKAHNGFKLLAKMLSVLCNQEVKVRRGPVLGKIE